MDRESILIEAEELKNKLTDPKLRIYDATIMFAMALSPEEAAKMPTAHALYQAGHIPGAAFFDHDTFSDMESDYEYMLASDEILEAAIGEIGIGNQHEVVVYASNGILATATRAWWLLRYAGVQNIRVLNGGLAAWKAAGGEVEKGESFYPAASFKANFNPAMFASKEEVQAAIEDASVRVENTLPQDWYDREHIPSSLCLPLTAISPDWSVLVPDDQLREMMKGTGAPRRIITYCGGGIAATVTAMAYLLLGHKNVAVYDGSLYEWKGEGLPLDNHQ